MSNIKITTAQFGARHNYAIPAAIAGRGQLDRFYTDACGTNGLGRLATLAARFGVSKGGVAALASRRPPPEVVSRTTTFDRFALKLRRALNRADPLTRLKIWDDATIEFGNLIERNGLGDTDVLYGVMHELGPLYGMARAKGIKVAADVCVVPTWEARVRDEQERYPSWAAPQPQFSEALGSGIAPYRHMFGKLDLWVCPSKFVRDDLISNFGVPFDDTVVVPYAVADQWFQLEPRPQKGRILFVGTANLRKGIHHFAKAAKELSKSGDSYDFRVAGAVSDDIRDREETRFLNFLGQIPRSEIHEEFQKADVFVLPSIAEGSAGVTYEALAAGLPIVTTLASGSVVSNGEEGFLCSQPHTQELAEAISSIVADRGLRDAMSKKARKTAEGYSWECFQERLTNALNGLLETDIAT